MIALLVCSGFVYAFAFDGFNVETATGDEVEAGLHKRMAEVMEKAEIRHRTAQLQPVVVEVVRVEIRYGNRVEKE